MSDYKFPYYSLTDNIKGCYLNPYEDMIEMAYSSYSDTLSMTVSLASFNNLDTNGKKAVIDKLSSKFHSDVTYDISRKAGNDCLVIKVPFVGEFIIKFITRPMQISLNNVACATISFTKVKCFDFVNVPSELNFMTFNEMYEEEHLLGNVLSVITMLCNFDDFLKKYKVDSIRAKNIYTFIDKFVGDDGKDKNILFYKDFFKIGCFVNNTLYTRKCSYETYLTDIKDFANSLKEHIHNANKN
jgi:hypothetical protein